MKDKTKYRVDVSKSASIVPCAMNSLRYAGDNWNEANDAFDLTSIHKDAWNKDNVLYGVILSIWDSAKNEYVVKRVKGFSQ